MAAFLTELHGMRMTEKGAFHTEAPPFLFLQI